MKIEPYNDCKNRGVTCKGHKNSWLECDLERKENRDLLLLGINRLMAEYERYT